MNIENIRKDLLMVINTGRLSINGEPLSLRELASLQQGVVYLYEQAKELEESKPDQKEPKVVKPADKK